jgi:transposase-like protein
MIAQCTHQRRKKHGRDRKGQQRYRCADCRKTFLDEAARPLGDMRINFDKATMALSLLLEGMSIRATERLTGIKRDTICNLILLVGDNRVGS